MAITQLFIENLSQFSQSGQVKLYHYSREDNHQVILDPQEFGKHSFSRREKKVSDKPRIFFYLDPTDKEKFFRSNAWNLYATSVDKDQIYDLTIDPKNLIQTVKDNNNGVLNFDELFNKIDKNYNGVYYTVKNRDIVAWFQPISVDTLEEEPVAV